jgi:hypothetical protein
MRRSVDVETHADHSDQRCCSTGATAKQTAKIRGPTLPKRRSRLPPSASHRIGLRSFSS